MRTVDPKDPLRIYHSVQVGDLCDLILLDTRSYRDQQDLAAVADSSRTLLGAAQADWLESELLVSRDRGARWRIIVQQVLMLQLKKITDRNADTWDGYQASRDRVLSFIRAEAIQDVVVLSGDWHSAWAGELAIDPFASAPGEAASPVAVEFHCPAVTSPLPSGLAQLWTDAQDLAPHPHVAWVDFAHRGYLSLDVTRDGIRAEWCFSQTTKERDPTHQVAKAFYVAAGSARLIEDAV